MKTKVNNNIKLKSGGGILNNATDGLNVDTGTTAGKIVSVDNNGNVPLTINKLVASASDNLKLSSDSESVVYASGRVKAIAILYTGIYRIKYDYATGSNGYSSNFKIHKNGIDTTLGAHSDNTGNYQTSIPVDLQCSVGDIIEIYAQSSSYSPKCRNFRIYFDLTRFSGDGIVIQ